MISVSRKSGLSSWDSLLEVTAFLGANANRSKTRTKSSAATCSVEQGSIGTPSVLLRCFCMPPRLERREDVKLCSRKKIQHNSLSHWGEKVKILCMQTQASHGNPSFFSKKGFHSASKPKARPFVASVPKMSSQLPFCLSWRKCCSASSKSCPVDTKKTCCATESGSCKDTASSSAAAAIFRLLAARSSFSSASSASHKHASHSAWKPGLNLLSSGKRRLCLKTSL